MLFVNIFRYIKRNPLYKFLFRLFGVLFISSILWLVLLFFYYEYELSYDIKDDIEAKRSKIITFLDNIEFEKKDKSYYNSMKSIEEYIKLRDIPFLKIYKNKKELFNIEIERLPPYVLEEIESSPSISEDRHKLLYHKKEAYLYLQTSFFVSGDSYHLNLVYRLDEKTIHLMNNNTLWSLSIVFSTIFIVFVSVFPLIYTQYKSLLISKKELVKSNISTLQSLGNAISKRDSDTSEHNYRVTFYSIKLAQKLGLDKKEIESLIKGAFLHDIGKIAISDNILLKPSKLTTEEFEIMKSHVLHGIDIIKDIPWLEDAKNVILYHHEKVDGTGYPKGLKANEIPLEARIFAVVDVFDALTSKRPYKKSFDINTSMMIIKSEVNKHFDEDIVKAFEVICKECYYEINIEDSDEVLKVFQKSLSPYFFNKV